MEIIQVVPWNFPHSGIGVYVITIEDGRMLYIYNKYKNVCWKSVTLNRVQVV